MKHTMILMLALLLFSCEKEQEKLVTTFDCNQFSESLLYNENSFAKDVIDSIALTLPPQPTASDELGHLANSQDMVTQINQLCDDIQVEMTCYACLESFPLQSSFKVTLDSMDISVERYFLVVVPEGNYMYTN